MPEDQQPVTRGDLHAELAMMKAEILDSVQENLATMKGEFLDSVQEMVRDAQTELLRGFARYSESEVIRRRKVEADVSNIDTSTSTRL